MSSADTLQPLNKGWNAQDSENDVILPVVREPGLNDVGMVAWSIVYKSPECSDVEYSGRRASWVFIQHHREPRSTLQRTWASELAITAAPSINVFGK